MVSVLLKGSTAVVWKSWEISARNSMSGLEWSSDACPDVMDAVSGSVGPLYFTSSGDYWHPDGSNGRSSIISNYPFLLTFSSIGKQIPPDALRFPAIILRDYSQQPIPISVRVDLSIAWEGKTVTTPVYLHSDLEMTGEPCLLRTNVVIYMCYHSCSRLVPSSRQAQLQLPLKVSDLAVQPTIPGRQCGTQVKREGGDRMCHTTDTGRHDELIVCG